METNTACVIPHLSKMQDNYKYIPDKKKIHKATGKCCNYFIRTINTFHHHPSPNNFEAQPILMGLLFKEIHGLDNFNTQRCVSIIK